MQSHANFSIRFVLYIAFLLISNLLSAQKVEAKKKRQPDSP